MKKSSFLIGLLCLLAGCSQQPDPRVDKLQNTVSQLSDKITQLSFVLSNENEELINVRNTDWTNSNYIWYSLKVVNTNVNTLTMDYDLLSSPYGSVVISPEAKGYSNLKTPYGPLLVTTESVEPYLDGYKVHLTIGNPTGACFHGFSLICSTFDSTNFFGTYRSITNDLTDTLNPLSWNKIEFVLAPATMDEVRNASVSVKLGDVSLANPLHDGNAD